MLAELHRLPHADVFHAFDNVQGTFQICRRTGCGIMTVTDDSGVRTIDLGWELCEQILSLNVQPPKERA